MISQEIRMLHYLAEARRGVNAAQIAAYIGQARETERVLLQQRRDAERRCAESGDCAETVIVPALPTIAEDIWAESIVVADFDELK